VAHERTVARLVTVLVITTLFALLLIANPVATYVGWRIFFFADEKLQAIWAGGILIGILVALPRRLWWAGVGALLWYAFDVQRSLRMHFAGQHLAFAGAAVLTLALLLRWSLRKA
jgi:hypothetical protein